jgi:hypothetical protein
MGPYELLQRIVEVFNHLGIPYLVTGSVGAMAYGEPRLTNDIDIVAGIEEQHVAGLVEAFPAADFYISENMIIEAIRLGGQFNIIHPSSGLKVDVIIRKDTPFDESRFSRIRRIKTSDSYTASFAAPEDIIIMKMKYFQDGGSEKHLRDIAGILKISRDDVDISYIADWSRRLDLTRIWEIILARIDESRNET